MDSRPNEPSASACKYCGAPLEQNEVCQCQEEPTQVSQRPLELVRRNPCVMVVALLKELLADAERGELLGLVALTHLPTGTQWRCSGEMSFGQQLACFEDYKYCHLSERNNDA